MKKTQWIELLHTIKQYLVSFVSLILFIAMGVAFFMSTSWTKKACVASLEKDFQDYSMHDMEIVYPLGLSKEELDVLKQEAALSEVEGLYVAYPQFRWNGIVYQGKVSSLSCALDKPHRLTGTLPNGPGEIAVEAAAAEKLGISIGDTITFVPDDDGHAYDIKSVRAGDYEALINGEKTADGMKYLTENTFKVTATMEHPAYSGISDRSYGLEPNRAIPVNLLLFVDESSFDVDAFDGYVDILISCQSLQGLDSLSSEFEKNYQEEKARVETALSSIISKDLNSLLDSASVMMEQQNLTVDDVYEQLAASYGLSQSDLSSLSSLTEPVISSRRYNSARNTIQVMAGIFNQMKYRVSLLFLLVSMMVCFFSIQRIIESQRRRIGIKKALGFTKRELMTSLLMYTLLAAGIGFSLGILLARFVLEPLLLNAILNSYVIDARVLCFSVWEAGGCLVVLLGSLLFVTACSGRHVIALPTLKLLYGTGVPKAKSHRYEKTRLWKKLSLFSKTVVNNCANDGKRVVFTLLGIGFSTALIVCAFSLKQAVTETFRYQFEEIEHYNTLVFFDNAYGECEEKLGAALTKKNIEYTALYTAMGILDNGSGETSYLSLKVPMDGNFSKFVECRPVKGSKDAKVYLTASVAKCMNIRPGDSICYTDAKKSDVEISVESVMEFYMASQLILTKDAFEEAFGYAPSPNTMLLSTTLSDRELTECLEDIEGFCYVLNYDETRENSYKTISLATMAIITVFLILSVALSFLVLLTLLVMFVEEKKNELIVLMINGYSMKKVRRYLLTDTVLLTILGTLAGILLGELLGLYAMDALTTLHSMAHKQLSASAAFFGTSFSVLFSAVTAEIALKKVETFQLSDIN